MRTTGGGLPMLARGLLFLLGHAARDRAYADLEAVRARVAGVRGPQAAQRACVREAAFMVGWAILDRARRVREQRESGVRFHFTGSTGMFADFMRDVRHGVRSLARRPGFTGIAVAVLGLGIGATATIFTIANRLFLEPPSGVAEPGALVTAYRSTGSFVSGSVSYPDYMDYRASAQSLESLGAASSGYYTVAARAGSGSSQVSVRLVTDNWFDVLGTEPVAGRWFSPEENQTQDTHPVAVVSWHYWRDALGAEASAVGREIVVNGHPFTIVGVAPRGFTGLNPTRAAPDLYVPILMLNALSPQSDAAWRLRMPDMRENWLEVVGRLRADGTVARVQAELSAVAARIYPPAGDRASEGVYVTPDYRWNPSRHRSLANLTRLLFVTVVGLLAVAATNLAILLLARTSARSREIGIRSAIGAGRGRVLRQLLTESLLIGVAGAALGLTLSMAASGSAAALLPVRVDIPARPDLRVLLFVTLVSVATALAVGVLPALRAARTDVSGMILGRGLIGGGRRVRDGLIIVQVALSLVLVAGAALFARSLRTAKSVDVGFDTGNTLLVRVDLGARGYDNDRGRVFLDEALARIRGLPGVAAATVTRQVPFQGEWTTTVRAWPGAAFADDATQLEVGLNAVADGYFGAMAIRLKQGRAIGAEDGSASQPVIVVNEAFARAIFPEGDVVGRTIPFRGDNAPPFQIVGLVADAKYYAFAEQPRPQVYLAIRQSFARSFSFLVKTSGPPLALSRSVQDVLHELDPDLAFPRVETLESVYDAQLAGYRTSSSVVGSSGVIALLLACSGLFGVMAHRVTERTREIGVRMALGATRTGVAGGVLRQGLTLVTIGVVLGLGGALVLGQFAQSLLFEVPARDVASLTIAPFVLLLAAGLAIVTPARRAMAIDPMRAMRSD